MASNARLLSIREQVICRTCDGKYDLHESVLMIIPVVVFDLAAKGREGLGWAGLGWIEDYLQNYSE